MTKQLPFRRTMGKSSAGGRAGAGEDNGIGGESLGILTEGSM